MAYLALRVATAALLATAAAQQLALDLDASPWEFEADPSDVGVGEQWFSAKARPTLERTITSPGAWQAQGVGNETALEFHQ